MSQKPPDITHHDGPVKAFNMLIKSKFKISFRGAIPSLMGFISIRTTVPLYPFPRSKHGQPPRQGTQPPFLPATLIFSSATKLGTAVVELVEFVPVPLITRLSTLDSNFPMRCKILSNSTARVFFRSVKENADS